MSGPHIVIIGGPNGAGKSTTAPSIVRDLLGVSVFVNADTIAQGLAAFDPAGSAIEAGRIMLRRLDELARRRADFSFETTLSSRHYARWIDARKVEGYHIHLVYLWLHSSEQALARVAERVGRGGHSIPDTVVRRRYERGIVNLFRLYLPRVDSWYVFDSSTSGAPRLIAARHPDGREAILDVETWKRMGEAIDESGQDPRSAE